MMLSWIIGSLAVAVGLFLMTKNIIEDANTPLRKWFNGMAESRGHELRLIGSEMTGTRFMALQLGGAAAAFLLGAFMGDILFWGAGVLCLVLPSFVLKSKAEQRVAEAEKQLDVWLLSLANALRSSPSLGEAIYSTTALTKGPLGQELDVAMKENKLGVTLDDALMNIGKRLKSPIISGSLAGMLVARQTGGDIASLLEESAASLREMARLEGVLRSKTSEARAQAGIMLCIPIAIVMALGLMDPEWFTPITASPAGWLVAGASIGLWLVALFLSRMFMVVDL